MPAILAYQGALFHLELIHTEGVKHLSKAVNAKAAKLTDIWPA